MANEPGALWRVALRLVIALMAAVALAHRGFALQCRTLAGAPADWFTLLKFPNSFEYAVMESAMATPGWLFGGELAHHDRLHPQPDELPVERSARADPLMRALACIYPHGGSVSPEDCGPSVGHVFYNDEFPYGTEHWDR